MRFLKLALAAAALLGMASSQTLPNIECMNQLPSGMIKSLGSGAGEFSVILSDSTFLPGSGNSIKIEITSNLGRKIPYFAISAVSDIYPANENYGNRRVGVFDKLTGAQLTCENADPTSGNALISTQAFDATSISVNWNTPKSASFSILFYTSIIFSSTEAYVIASYLHLNTTDNAEGNGGSTSNGGPKYWGVNIGAVNDNTEFFNKISPMNHKKDNEVTYIQPEIPSYDTLKYFLVTKGFNLIRFPVSWELFQPTLNGDLDATWVNKLTGLATSIASFNGTLVLDLHSFGFYKSAAIGATNSSVTKDNFANVWGKIAANFSSYENVIFGLMNQPHDLLGSTVTAGSSELWIANVNAALASIRAAGANQLVLLPGNGWSRVADWWGTWTKQMDYGTANSETMVGQVDPINNYAYDVNHFFTEDGNGNSDECYIVDSLPLFANFLIWLQNNGKKAFLSMVGTSDESVCQISLKIALKAVVENPDHWLGWAYYLAGEESTRNSFSIQPSNDTTTGILTDATQMAWLEPFLNSNPPAGSTWKTDVLAFIQKYTPAATPTVTSSSFAVSSDRSVLMFTFFAVLALMNLY